MSGTLRRIETSRSSGILIYVCAATRLQWVKRGNRRMRIFPNTSLVRADQLDTNQRDIVTAVVYEISSRLILRLRRQLVVIHLPSVFPVDPKYVGLPHTRDDG